ncbi:expressed protein [Phakopsora pachyrhizi]|uniref:Expressed protein n=1 Tax=Phakopsora pachyrhizi TaxID=170000 RepID=A0AAV0AXF0_PHAPC|nr:expressed protein [Phakopsora pachyrhizi]
MLYPIRDYLNGLGLSLKLTSKGLALPSEDQKEDAKASEHQEDDSLRIYTNRLNQFSNDIQDIVFSKNFSSLLAGSSNESDQSIDLPTYLGQKDQNNNDEDDNHLSWIMGRLGLKDLSLKRVRIVDRIRPSLKLNQSAVSTSEKSQDQVPKLKVLNSLNLKDHQTSINQNQPSSKNNESDKVYSILNQFNKLSEEDLVHFEIDIPSTHSSDTESSTRPSDQPQEQDDEFDSSSRTICVLVGKLDESYAGLISYRIST